mgnify:FL=1
MDKKNNNTKKSMASISSYNHVIVVNAPAAAFFTEIDFGTNRELDGRK